MKNLSAKGKERIKATCSSQFCKDCKAREYCAAVLGEYSLCESMELLNEVQENTFYEILFDEDVRDCDFEEEEDNITKEETKCKYIVVIKPFKLIKATESNIKFFKTLEANGLIKSDCYKIIDSFEIIE